MWCGSTKRLSSVDHFLRIKAVHRLAREDLKKAKASGKFVTVCIGWEKDLAMHRLDLGKNHLEAALAETLCKRRLQEYAAQAFELATVYRMTDSGEAGAQIREFNRIQRYNIWKMGQAAWKWARQAAASGDSTLDERQYFLAKRRYLQCLSRLDKQEDKQVDTQVDERAERS
jgi:hypothetical protein